MNSFSYMKYRLQNHDTGLKQRLYLLLSFVSLLVILPIIIFFKPLTSLKNVLSQKSETYLALKDTKEAQKANIIATKDYALPMKGSMTSGYGMRNDPFSGKSNMHTGVDISGRHWDTVRTIADGTVTMTNTNTGAYGNYIEIEHHDKSGTFYSFYAHLSSIKVTTGQVVKKGDDIGVEGGEPYEDVNPGNSTGHHLHFEIRTNSGYGNDINPTPYLSIEQK